jgi:hypothetical protein
MATQQYNVGLDFGTYQSKACILHVDADPTIHEFFQFSDPMGGSTFFLPSRVYLMADNTFHYGFPPHSKVKKSYDYFKIAAAEDEEFQVVRGYSNRFYRKRFEDLTPETLAVLYLTFVLFKIEDKFEPKNKKQASGGGLLGMLRRKEEPEQIRMTTQLGIPTEYSSTVNIKRKRKYENILVLAKLLIEKYQDIQSFYSQDKDTLLEDIRTYVDELIKAKESSHALNEKLEEFGISVYPETAAGLTYLVKSGRLEPGFFLAMDIGGGSSDVSYFRVTREQTIDYLAAESLLLAANNVFLGMNGGGESNLDTIKSNEVQIRQKIEDDSWRDDKLYVTSAENMKKGLEAKIKEIFCKRILFHYRHFQTKHIREVFEGQPCFVYGGGSMLPSNRDKMRLLIYDSGCPSTQQPEMLSHMSKRWLDEYLPSEYILPDDESWKSDIGLLIVAFGLSYLHGDKETYWEETNYHNRDLKKESYKLVPHPVNEDQYVYDVLAQKWY